MKTPLMDLKGQYELIREQVNQAILRVLDSGQYILGPEVKKLEEEVAHFVDASYGIGVANGTDALVLSLDAAGIGPGDEVLTTPFTFFATAEAISRVGATPVFVDIDPKTYNLDPDQLETHRTEKTRAILPVHIFGQAANMVDIMACARDHHWFVLEDGAQAIGAEFKGHRVGSLGHAATFSFFPTKNLGGYGDGGMIVTNDEHLATKIRSLRVHGSDPTSKYINRQIGYNSRLDELQAAALRIKLKYLEEWNQARRECAQLYDHLLSNLPIGTPQVLEGATSVYHLYIIQSEERDALMAHLQKRGMATNAYYTVPLHLQIAYRELGYQVGSLPHAEALAKRTLALPLYPEMKEETIYQVADAVKEFYQGTV
ncbi:DegT/DnrJ/EryC1/StrS family aminotransferase [Marininema halotolerans]|uniref:dTDP-4-amino-4,6-dideoxygalactose transaminase n=1 Tax=Marininema halotolerans TaxID=1155944 RepID=A0A1I6P1F2_9BACL|nr:DegT/DnrJ/EryC1/StrS family aminotransferase [Marininema halotolerans]SFS33910.1 dTDP-4-amino-4,6-dideoxygalactose transaminase [Marininema halotolerans]